MANTAQNPIILTYHSIGAGRPPLTIPLALFIEQMEWLSRNARVVPLGDVIDAIKHHRPALPKMVALTFDDGYRDFLTQAAPQLLRFGFPATIFLPTAYCGRTNSWAGQPGWVEENPLLSWQEIQKLSEQGFQFGAHSATHPDMTRLSAEQADWEMVTSKREVERHTGRPARFFAYPYGRWSPAVRDLVSRHFQGGVSTGAGTVGAEADPFALPRVDAHYLRRAACFRSLFSIQFNAYLGFRRFLRRLRRQPEGYAQGPPPLE